MRKGMIQVYYDTVRIRYDTVYYEVYYDAV